MLSIIKFNKVFRRDALDRVPMNVAAMLAIASRAASTNVAAMLAIASRTASTNVAAMLAIATALASLLLSLPGAPAAHADGGAPNLAYVAGANGGVGVIDIGGQ